MKLTIRKKVFLLLAAYSVVLVFFGILCNGLFLENYYIKQNKASLRTIAGDIEQNLGMNRDDLDDYVNEVDRESGISIRVTDAQLRIIYSSYTKRKNTDNNKLPKEIEAIVLDAPMSAWQQDLCDVAVNDNGNPSMIYIHKTARNDFVILSKGMKGIRESVAIANQFYLFVGLGLILIGAMVTVVFSRMITKPIQEMSRVASSIADLNFDERVHATSSDEVGVLGRSINFIAEKLSDSIHRMQLDIERQKLLVRNLSHELKTPIGVIKGYTEGLKYGVANDQQKAEYYCEVITDECDRMNDIVCELLDLSRLESAEATINKSTFAIHSLTASISERFAGELKQKEVDFEIHCPEGASINADYGLLERALGNYMTNAIRHTAKNGTISLSVELKEECIVFSVENTGSHIPDNELERIWQVFYQCDLARSRSSGGHGIGLSIVKSIAHLHGGEVYAINTDTGVKFFLQLPR